MQQSRWSSSYARWTCKKKWCNSKAI